MEDRLPAISLCMVVRDEEAFLGRCLASVSRFVSEIIVVDTGSNDRTRDIARESGANLIEFTWNGDFAEARNTGLRHASCDWILVLDADEEWAEADIPVLLSMLARPEVYGCYVQMISYVGSQAGKEYVTDTVCRLFRRDPRIAFEGRIHEDVTSSIRAVTGADFVNAPITVKHYGYLDSVLQTKQKADRNLRMLQEIVEKDPSDLRMQYALGTEYFQAGDYARALNVLHPLIPRIPVYAGYMSDLVLKTAFAWKETGKPDEAEALVDEALLFYPDYPDLLDLKALLCLDREKLDEALEAVGQALLYGDRSMQYTTTSGSGSYRSRYIAGKICEQMFRWEEAADHYRMAVEMNPGYAPAWRRLAVITLAEGAAAPIPPLSELPSSFVMSIWLEAAIDTWRNGFAHRLIEDQSIADSKTETFDSPTTFLLAAVLHAQCGEHDHARRTLLRMLEHPQARTEAALYLWALAMKEGDTREGLRLITQLAIVDPQFSSAEALLHGMPFRSFPLAPYRRCQLALVRCGAWESFLGFAPPPIEGRVCPFPWLPEGGMFGFLQAPEKQRRKLIEICHARKPLLAYAELIAGGAVAHSIGLHYDGIDFFRMAHSMKPERLAPFVGMANCYTEAARSHVDSVSRLLSSAVSMCLIIP